MDFNIKKIGGLDLSDTKYFTNSYLDFASAYANTNQKLVDSIIERQYMGIFGKSPYRDDLPGSKILSEEAKENLADYEIKIVNENVNYEKGPGVFKLTNEFEIELKRKGEV